jgi:hypothetical protein
MVPWAEDRASPHSLDMPLRHLWPAAQVWFWQAATSSGRPWRWRLFARSMTRSDFWADIAAPRGGLLARPIRAQSRQAFVDERDCCGTFADRAAYTLHRSRARVTNGVHARHARLERHGCGPRSASITSGTGGNQAPFFAAQRTLGLARRMAHKPFLAAFGKPLIRSS